VIELGRAYLHFEYEWRSTEELEEVASRAFDFAEQAAREFLTDFGVVDAHVILLEGSGRLAVRFRKAGKVAVAALVACGGLRTGIDYAERDIRLGPVHTMARWLL